MDHEKWAYGEDAVHVRDQFRSKIFYRASDDLSKTGIMSGRQRDTEKKMRQHGAASLLQFVTQLSLIV